MEPEKPADGRTVHGDFRPASRESDPWLMVLIAMSALGLIVLSLALTGHL